MKISLKNLRNDLSASIVVFFVALPLCLGIALASGAPLFSGIIAGIVGGIVVGAASGSHLGVSGPAAGLAVIILGYVATLGSFENLLVAIILAGIIQVIMGYLKLGTIAYYFPSSVIKGMLAGIGIIIIIKQLPHALGYDAGMANDLAEYANESAINKLQETLSHLSVNAIFITIVSLTIIVSWEVLMKKHKFFRTVQAPFVVVMIGIILSNFIELHDHQIVQIPVAKNAWEFFGQFTLPNFSQPLNPQIYSMALVIAVVASVETLLCVEATDKLDSQKRVTPTNRELKAQGLGNIVSGLIGGLPITQVIVRSSANISFGAKTKASTILHGFFLLISAITIPSLLNMIPLASLACILLFVGYKLAKPEIFTKIYKLGFNQFVPFIVTIFGMIYFDLLKGVMLGIATATLFILYHNFRNACDYMKIEAGKKPDEHLIKLAEEVSFLNKGAILERLHKIPANSTAIIDASKSKTIDYDVIEIIRDFQINARSKNIDLTVKGVTLNKI